MKRLHLKNQSIADSFYRMHTDDDVSWLYLDLNSFFASCEQQENPTLRGKPIAVVPMLADTTSVIAASYPAKRFGIKTGTKVADAKRMCPGLILVETNHDVYVRYHHRIIEVVESCIPVEAVASIDEIACRLTGSQRKVEKAVVVAQSIKKALNDKVGEAIKASIGISTNRYLAKMATDMQKPDGLTIIQRKDLPHKLYSLKLRDVLGVGEKTEKHLLSQGIDSVEKLCGLTQPEMMKAWGGIWGERIFSWLKGDEVDLPPTQTKSMSHEHVLPPELRTYDGAHAIAKKLLSKLCVRMRKNGYYTRALTVDVKFLTNRFGSGSDKWSKNMSVPEVRDTLTLLHKLNEIWQECPRHAKPLRVGVSFSNLIKNEVHQFSFFENPKLDEISRVMDNINRKYGKEAVHLGATHGQEKKAPTHIAFKRIPDLDEL